MTQLAFVAVGQQHQFYKQLEYFSEITFSKTCTLSINFSGNLTILQFIQFCLFSGCFQEFTFL